MSEPIHIENPGIFATELIAGLHLDSFPDDTGERWRPQDIRQVMQMPGVLCFVARRGEAPLGYALARVIVDDCELLSLGVVRRARRTGVARALVDHLKEICRARSVKRLFLEVREDNEAALRVYGGRGFEVTGRRVGYYRMTGGVTKDAITMSYTFVK